MNINEFFKTFKLSNGKYAVCKGNIPTNNFHFIQTLKINEESDTQLFFKPAQYKKDATEFTKDGVLGTNVLWLDIDSEKYPKPILPPTFTIFSGHGYHLYYLLHEPIYDIDLIEQLNKLLILHTPNSDNSTFNVDRWLRIPGSLNKKKKPYKRVKIIAFNPFQYTITDIQVLKKLNKKTKHKILTGDKRGFKSRSERDYSVILALVKAGATNDLITQLFHYHPVGDKVLDTDTHETYLTRSIAKIRASLPNVDEHHTLGLVAEEDGYYWYTKNSSTKISTFILQPKLLIDGSEINQYDSLVCDVHCIDKKWSDITFSKEAFTSTRLFDKTCHNINWQWLGNEYQLKRLLVYLLDKLNSEGLQITKGVPYTGLYKHENEYYFIGTDKVLSSNSMFELFKSPVSWLSDKPNNNSTNLMLDCTKEEIQYVGNHLPNLNEPGVIWPLIGWYTISLIKPYLELINRRLPILSVTGAKGAGKTTLIKIFMQLFGQTLPKTYNANTTRFVILSLLGSTYSLPIAFSEFRYEAVQSFLRFILLAYDTGNDARGNANQTITNYPLIAPFTLDGEDELIDPAVKERIITAKLNANNVLEGTEYFKKFKKFKVVPNFGGNIIQYLLNLLNKDKIINIINEAEKDLFSTFIQHMPDRIRNNHILVLAGCYLFSDFTGISRPKPDVLHTSINQVFNLSTLRIRLLVDTFIEYIVNCVAIDEAKFKHTINSTGHIFYFQLSTAYPAWLLYQKRAGNTILEREAIRSQLQETTYYKGTEVYNDVLMYKVDLSIAYDLGLDIPKKLAKTKLTIEWLD